MTTDAYVPAEQLTQADARTLLKVPALQAVQALGLNAPITVE
jgi:hypothetical protein